MSSRPSSLLTPTFLLVTASALAYFVSIGALAPVLPLYVERQLGGGGAEVGLAVGAFAVSAALLRPWVGHVGDRRGRRVLVIGGAATVAGSVVLYGVVEHLAWLVAMRFVTGVGEAAVFVGAATAAQDLAPADRRGEAASYFSVAVYGGLAMGPVLGEAVRDASGTTTVWLVAAAWSVVACVLGWWVPVGELDETPPDGRRRWLQPDAIRPGVVLAMATTGFAGFAAFLPLYVDDIGVGGVGPVFALLAGIVLAFRILGARVPDRLGPVLAPTTALVLLGGGLFILSLWNSAVGLYVATVVYAFGLSLLYPALLPLVFDAAPVSQRSQAMATFTLFFDIATGLGALVLGVVVAVANEPAAFFVAGGVCFAAVPVLRSAARRPVAAVS